MNHPVEQDHGVLGQRHAVSMRHYPMMNVGDPQTTRVQHVMEMPIKPHSHDHAAIDGIQYSARPWISGNLQDRGANHNETSWGRGFLGTVPQAYPVNRDCLEAALLGTPALLRHSPHVYSPMQCKTQLHYNECSYKNKPE